MDSVTSVTAVIGLIEALGMAISASEPLAVEVGYREQSIPNVDSEIQQQV